MKLAVLFWFYKNPAVCKNRLELIKKHNPDIKIYGLFGGRKKEAGTFRKQLAGYLDDFYISSYADQSRSWKWIHGDLMVLEWFTGRGKQLPWNSVVVVQWDMLILGPLKKQFPGLRQGQLFLSGYRALDKNIEKKWRWTKGRRLDERPQYLAFQKFVREKYNYTKRLKCCLFILQVFPRAFFQKWQKLPNRQQGMLEYSLPTYADMLNVPIYKRKLGVWWFNKRAHQGMTPLNARGKQINDLFIASELRKKKGYRIFHPYTKRFSGE